MPRRKEGEISPQDSDPETTPSTAESDAESLRKATEAADAARLQDEMDAVERRKKIEGRTDVDPITGETLDGTLDVKAIYHNQKVVTGPPMPVEQERKPSPGDAIDGNPPRDQFATSSKNIARGEAAVAEDRQNIARLRAEAKQEKPAKKWWEFWK